MLKKLIKHGNSYALIIEKPILELLGFKPNRPLRVTTDGKRLIIQDKAKSKGDADISPDFTDSLDNVNRQFGEVLQRLA